MRQAGQIATTPEALRAVRRQPGAERRGRAGGDGQHARDRARCCRAAVARVVVVATRRRRGRSPRPRSRPTRSTPRSSPQLLAADYLPAVWVADERHPGAAAAGRAARAHRAPAHPAEEPGAGDPASQPRSRAARPPTCSGTRAARWLAEQELPADERQAVAALLRQLDFHGEELRLIDAELAQRRAGPPGRPAVDDDPRRRRDRRAVDRRRGRRLLPLPLAGQAGRLPRAEPAGPAVRRPARRARADHQAGPRARPRDARRGRLGRRPRRPARCARSISASGPAAGCRSPSSPPPASSPCCAGT